MLPTAPLRIRNFRLLWIGQAVSQFGDSFYYLVFMYMVAKITGSAAMVGYVGMMETLPFLFFSFYAGVVADRLDRKLIMLIADLLSFGILTAFAFLIAFQPNPPVWSLFVAVGSLSIVTAFILPARAAALPNLVPSDLLLSANALLASTRNIMPVASYAITGTVLAALYAISPTGFFVAAIIVNALTFLVSAMLTLKLPSMKPDRADTEKHPWTDFKEGLRYIRSRAELVTLLICGMVIHLFIGPFFVAYIATNDAWFGGKPHTLAWLELSFFVGMLFGSLLVAKAAVKNPGIAYVWGIAICGIGVALMAFSQNILLYGFWNLMAGVAIPFSQIPLNTYIQQSVPDGFLGRVNSALVTLSMGAMPIGAGLGGVLIDAIGLVTTYLIMGGGMVLAAVVALCSGPFRNIRLTDAPAEVAAP